MTTGAYEGIGIGAQIPDDKHRALSFWFLIPAASSDWVGLPGLSPSPPGQTRCCAEGHRQPELWEAAASVWTPTCGLSSALQPKGARTKSDCANASQ